MAALDLTEGQEYDDQQEDGREVDDHDEKKEQPILNFVLISISDVLYNVLCTIGLGEIFNFKIKTRSLGIGQEI